MKARPTTTLFLLVSIDGKISTGDTAAMDFDTDLPRIRGVKTGLHQYYELERKTDFFSLNSGAVFEKIGVNKKVWTGAPIPVRYIVVDNKPHLTLGGLRYLAKKSVRVFIITTNKKHPAFSAKETHKNIEIIFQKKFDLATLSANSKQNMAQNG